MFLLDLVFCCYSPAARLGYTIGNTYAICVFLVLLPFMKKVLKLSDSTTALVAIICTSTGFILPVITDTSQWFKVGSFVGNWFSLSLIFGSLSPSLMLIVR